MIDKPQTRSRASSVSNSSSAVARRTASWSDLVASDGISPDAVRKLNNRALIALIEQDCLPKTPAGCADVIHWCAMYDAKHVLAAFLDRWPAEIDKLDISPAMSTDKNPSHQPRERLIDPDRCEAVVDTVLDKLLPHGEGSLKSLGFTGSIDLPSSGGLASAVRRSATLENLSISTGMEPVTATDLLCEVFDAAADSRSMKSLSVTQVLAEHPAIGASINALFASGQLETLKFTHADFPVEAAEAMAKALASSTCNVKTLSLFACFRGRGGSDRAAIVLEGLKRNTSIETLDFSRNELHGDALKILCDLLKHNKSVTRLQLAGCKCGPEAAEALGEALSVNRTLVELDLSSNMLEDAEPLVKGLRGNPALRHLNLGMNWFFKEEGAHLAELVQDSALESLDISNNALASIGVDPIMLALTSKCSLTHLELRDVGLLQISDGMIEGLGRNESLTCLNLTANEAMFGSRINDLFEALDNKKIELLISGYALKDAQIEKLADALAANSGIVGLTLDTGIDNGTTLICKLAEHIGSNYTLQKLDVSLDPLDPTEADAETRARAQAQAQARIAQVTGRNAAIHPGIESCFEKFAVSAEPQLLPELGLLILEQFGSDNDAAMAKHQMRMTVRGSRDQSSAPAPSSGGATSTMGGEASGV